MYEIDCDGSSLKTRMLDTGDEHTEAALKVTDNYLFFILIHFDLELEYVCVSYPIQIFI